MAKSKMLDLVRVTNAATKLLMRMETTVSNLSELTGPAVPPTAIGRLIPSRHLGHLVALRAAAEDLKPVFLEQHVWEFAGLASPSGIPVGAGFWSSAHLLMSDVATIVQATTQDVLDDRGIYDRAVSTYKPDSGTASIAKDACAGFDEHWNLLAHRRDYEHPEDEIDRSTTATISSSRWCGVSCSRDQHATRLPRFGSDVPPRQRRQLPSPAPQLVEDLGDRAPRSRP